jgi:hypothetical protein
VPFVASEEQHSLGRRRQVRERLAARPGIQQQLSGANDRAILKKIKNCLQAI